MTVSACAHTRVKGAEAQKANGDVCVAHDIHCDSQDKDIMHYWFSAAMKRRKEKRHKQIVAGARGRRR